MQNNSRAAFSRASTSEDLSPSDELLVRGHLDVIFGGMDIGSRPEALERVIRRLMNPEFLLPKIVLTQVFTGVVKTVTDKAVLIEFLIDDDLELRTFEQREFKPDWDVRPGSAVQVTCELSSVPPSPPLSPQEIREWKAKYGDTAGYLRKTRRTGQAGSR